MARTAITDLLTAPEIAQELGQRLMRERRRRGVSRQQLAESTGVSVPTIGRFERDGVTTIVVFVKLLQALGAIEAMDQILAQPQYETLDEFMNATARTQ